MTIDGVRNLPGSSPEIPPHDGLTVWFTGLSGSGKTTICNAVFAKLAARGYQVEVLDGDEIRKHISKDLGFTKQDRNENIRRIGSIASLLTRNRRVVLVAAISPYRVVREEVRVEIGRFIEVFVNAPLEVCERRDPKGLYKRARRGELPGFTGIDDPYESPPAPEVQCETEHESVEICANKVVTVICNSLRL